MQFCRNISELYVKVINVLALILSVVILAFGGYLAANFGDDLKNIDLSSPILVTVVFGAFLLIFSIIGLVGVYQDSKWLLFIYIIGSIVITLGVLATGAALLAYGGFLVDVREGNLDKQIKETILHFELAVFEDCCAGVAPVCADIGVVPPCILDQEVFDKFKNFVGDRTCSVMESLEVNGSPVVGDPAQGGCGGGNLKVFVDNISTAIEDNLKSLGIANIVIAVVMLLLLSTACVLLWTKEEKDGNYK